MAKCRPAPLYFLIRTVFWLYEPGEEAAFTSYDKGDTMMKGTLYCIGVGPGDPELITVKALKRIQACPVLAAPQGRAGVGTAKDILLQAVAAMAT